MVSIIFRHVLGCISYMRFSEKAGYVSSNPNVNLLCLRLPPKQSRKTQNLLTSIGLSLNRALEILPWLHRLDHPAIYCLCDREENKEEIQPLVLTSCFDHTCIHTLKGRVERAKVDLASVSVLGPQLWHDYEEGSTFTWWRSIMDLLLRLHDPTTS